MSILVYLIERWNNKNTHIESKKKIFLSLPEYTICLPKINLITEKNVYKQILTSNIINILFSQNRWSLWWVICLWLKHWKRFVGNCQKAINTLFDQLKIALNGDWAEYFICNMYRHSESPPHKKRDRVPAILSYISYVRTTSVKCVWCIYIQGKVERRSQGTYTSLADGNHDYGGPHI